VSGGPAGYGGEYLPDRAVPPAGLCPG